MNCIFLIGMPGSGKTHWGKRIAEAYGFGFIDTDTQIEASTGHSIASLFERKGEAAFRQLETDLLQQTIKEVQHPTIVSCGGGMPFFNNNIGLMKASGCVIYIWADVPLLASRLEAEAQNRPLLAGENLDIVLKNVLHKRKAVYEQADYTVDAANLSLNNFTQIISACISRH